MISGYFLNKSVNKAFVFGSYAKDLEKENMILIS